MRKRGAQKATPQMGRMGAEDPLASAGRSSGMHQAVDQAQLLVRAFGQLLVVGD